MPLKLLIYRANRKLEIEIYRQVLCTLRYIQHENLNYKLKIFIRKTLDNVQILPDVAEKRVE